MQNTVPYQPDRLTYRGAGVKNGQHLPESRWGVVPQTAKGGRNDGAILRQTKSYSKTRNACINQRVTYQYSGDTAAYRDHTGVCSGYAGPCGGYAVDMVE